MNHLINSARKLVKAGDSFLKEQGIKKFHLKAQDLLFSSGIHDFYDFQGLVEATFDNSLPSRQNYGSFEFSDFPITLARGEHCFIDLYFWRRRPTVIHNHHFSGAFMCIEGVNVDLEFLFKKTRKLGKYHALGDLTLHQTRQIKKGDIASINLLDKFIHQNHHQADLTVNLCFRTPELSKSNISNYLYSGLKYEKAPLLLRRIDSLMSFCAIDDFDIKKVKLDVDDAITFIIRMYGSQTQNPRLIKLLKRCEKLVKNEIGLNISELVHQHEKRIDALQDLYD